MSLLCSFCNKHSTLVPAFYTLFYPCIVALVFDVSNETHKYTLPSHVSYKIRMDADRVETTDRVLDQ